MESQEVEGYTDTDDSENHPDMQGVDQKSGYAQREPQQCQGPAAGPPADCPVFDVVPHIGSEYRVCEQPCVHAGRAT